ncbi:uncharacterized protein [Misgurnus anguillicaudatus]|uniref:uncharacterized protein n=1 Tax=Misgurnus anguillicaudatus TaxID=75329 RepID=UPI003CCF63F1
MLLCFLLLVSVIQDKCIAQKITPLQDTTVETTEGDSVTLSCKYEGSVYSLLWYRQYPGSKPEFLLLIMESSTKSVTYANPRDPRLDGEVNMQDKRVHLEISSVKVKDSALYYCALTPTVTGNTTILYKTHHVLKTKANICLSVSSIIFAIVYMPYRYMYFMSHKYDEKQTDGHNKSFGQSITPMQNETRATEGETVILSCKYDTQAHTPFLRLNATVNKMKKQVDLKISSVSITDSALYYCVSGEGITSLSSAEFAVSGNSVTLSCNYAGSYNIDVLLWYRQSFSSTPEFLFLINEGNFQQTADPPIQGVSAKINDEKNQVYLEISSVKASDSAVYYCALKPTLHSDRKQNNIERYLAKAQKDKKQLDLEISKTEVTDSVIYYCALKPTVTGNTSTLYKNIV